MDPAWRNDVKIARVAILTDPASAERRRASGINVQSEAYTEMLEHRGITFTEVYSITELRSERTDLVLVACGPDTAEGMQPLLEYAQAGGIVVSCGGLRPLARALGFTPAAAGGPGYAVGFADDDELCFLDELAGNDEPLRLRYLHAEPWVPHERSGRTNGDGGRARCALGVPPAYGRAYDLLHEVRVGAGLICRVAVDVGQTVVHLRQGGSPVFQDGLPAPDGTADVDDGVLKADDAVALDWLHDRRRSETGIPFFPHPYADWWSELLVGYLIRLAWRAGMSIPFIEYWPAGIRQTLLISHDSDGNVDHHAQTTLDLLRETGVRSTWCILSPGYSPDLLREAHERGHEIAFHYNAVPEDGGTWAEMEFAEQLRVLRSALPGIPVISNKNHLTRVEGWGTLFEWCEDHGIQADQTRGPSKKGNLGFPFATCHAYRPVAWWDEANRRYDVLEMGFLSPDMNTGKWGDESLIQPILEATQRVAGIAHLLFHQVHLHEREPVRRAFTAVLERAREMGFASMTGAEVNRWERLRRAVRLSAVGSDGGARLTGPTTAAGTGLTVLVPMERGSSRQRGTAGPGTAQRYGIPCRRTVF